MRLEPRIVPPLGSMPRQVWMSSGIDVSSTRPAPAVEEADDLVAEVLLAFADHGADDCVQPGAVPPAGENSKFHNALLFADAPGRLRLAFLGQGLTSRAKSPASSNPL